MLLEKSSPASLECFGTCYCLVVIKRWRVGGTVVVPTSGGGRSLTSLFALALHFSPLRDYDSLRKEDVFENNRLVRCQLGGSDLRFVNPQ